MLSVTLSGWISMEIWRVCVVFARIGAAFTLLPGFGETGIPQRLRLLASMMCAIALAPAVAHIPPVPAGAWGLFLGLLPEITTGVLLGAISRTMVSGVLTAGTIIGQNIGMANIFVQGMGYEQSAALGAGIYAGLIAAFFAADGHHLILRALMGSYDVVGPCVWPDVEASARAMMHVTRLSFELAAELSMPFLALALVFNASLALVNRVMPALPVFQLGQPALVLVGLYLIATASPMLVERVISAYSDILLLMR